jgi:hypothetical protein
VGKPDTLARLTLRARPSEQFEHALSILIGDASSVVADVDSDAAARFGP